MDSYRYLNRITRTAVKAWIKREPYREIPWTPLRKPLAHSIAKLLTRRPWLVAKFLSGDIPEPRDWSAS